MSTAGTGQSATGTSNEVYDLVQFFQQIQEDSSRAQKAQQLLGRIVRQG